MTIILVALCVYAMYITTVAVMVFSAQRRDRVSALFIAVCFPVLALLALVQTVFTGWNSEISPCPNGLEEAEALIERKRQVLFNASPVEPTLSRIWRKRYEMSLELKAEQARRLSIQMKELIAAV